MESTTTVPRARQPFWTASVLIPGWGQLCQARASFVVWFIVTIALYIANWRFGVIAHNLCVLDAFMFSLRQRSASTLSANA